MVNNLTNFWILYIEEIKWFQIMVSLLFTQIPCAYSFLKNSIEYLSKTNKFKYSLNKRKDSCLNRPHNHRSWFISAYWIKKQTCFHTQHTLLWMMYDQPNLALFCTVFFSFCPLEMSASPRCLRTLVFVVLNSMFANFHEHPNKNFKQEL